MNSIHQASAGRHGAPVLAEKPHMHMHVCAEQIPQARASIVLRFDDSSIPKLECAIHGASHGFPGRRSMGHMPAR